MIFQRLINRLHRVFNKEPEDIPVLTVSYSGGVCLLTVSSLRLTTKAATELDIDLSAMTLSDMVSAINAVSGYSASVASSEYGKLLARGLMEDSGRDISATSNLNYPSSLLWAELRTVGWMLDEQMVRLELAEKQLYINKASEDWLDYWGRDFFGVVRHKDETDTAYATRIIKEVISANQNNRALEIMLKEAMPGLECSVLDSANNIDLFYHNGKILRNGTRRRRGGLYGPDCSFRVIVTGVLNYTESQLRAVVERHKAAGTSIEYIDTSGVV